MELPGDGSWWVVGADAASATVVANDAVVVARIVADAGVKYLVGERLSGWRLSSLATAQQPMTTTAVTSVRAWRRRPMTVRRRP
jgi:hypothetical protein